MDNPQHYLVYGQSTTLFSLWTIHNIGTCCVFLNVLTIQDKTRDRSFRHITHNLILVPAFREAAKKVKQPSLDVLPQRGGGSRFWGGRWAKEKLGGHQAWGGGEDLSCWPLKEYLLFFAVSLTWNMYIHTYIFWNDFTFSFIFYTYFVMFTSWYFRTWPCTIWEYCWVVNTETCGYVSASSGYYIIMKWLYLILST